MTAVERFSAKYIVAETGCWLWQACTAGKGYGRFGSRWAHRWAYEHFRGPIPPKMQVDHLCRVRHCVNPIHMELVTNQENTKRGLRPAQLSAERRAITHCAAGHPLSGKNLRIKHYKGQEWRRCRLCESKWNRMARERRATA